MEEEVPPQMIDEDECPIHILQILSCGVGVSTKNAKFMVSYKLLTLFPFCVLVLATSLVQAPIIGNIISTASLIHDMVNPNEEIIGRTLKYFRMLLELELLSATGFFFVPLLSLVVTIYISSNQSNLKEWFVKIDISWKRSLITWFYITLISTVLVTMVLILASVFSQTLISTPLIILIMIITISSSIFYTNVVSVWVLSLVISVVEENQNGVRNIGRNEDFIREKRLQGFGLTLILSIISVVIYTLFWFLKDQINRRTKTKNFEIEIWVLGYVCLVKLFMFLVYSGFYYECKIRNGRQELEIDEGRLSHALISSYEV